MGNIATREDVQKLEGAIGAQTFILLAALFGLFLQLHNGH
jgi:hypothetical protein